MVVDYYNVFQETSCHVFIVLYLNFLRFVLIYKSLLCNEDLNITFSCINMYWKFQTGVVFINVMWEIFFCEQFLIL